jgi:large subunit ribosomal protein L17
MRHGKKVNHLSRTNSHRKAMLGNMATSLILHKRITTTLAKAKALRVYVEPILTKAKSDTTHSRRIVFSYLQDKEAVTILFREIAEKIATRPGGYTRIIKMENRLGDNAEMALIELVDYNTVYGTDTGKAEKKSTRRRGAKGKAPVAAAPAVAAPAAKAAPAKEEVVEVAPIVETPVAEAPVVEQAVIEETPVAEAEAPETPTASAEHEENAEKGE